jgi:hypothetical protein
MIKQRMPFWLYSLEELRCDLNTFREATRLTDQPHGKLVQYAILFDRLFRFPITGNRIRNYDGLGGQLLFAYLHKHHVLRGPTTGSPSTGPGCPRSSSPCAKRSKASTGTGSTGRN